VERYTIGGKTVGCGIRRRRSRTWTPKNRRDEEILWISGIDGIGLGFGLWTVDWRNSSPLESVYDGTVGLDLCTGVPLILSVCLPACLSASLPVCLLALLLTKVVVLPSTTVPTGYVVAPVLSNF